MAKKHIAALIFCALAVPTSALAATPLPISPDQTSLTWTELKEACADPGAYGNQLAPTNIHIECADTKTSWRVASVTPGSSHYNLLVSVSSTKGFVAPDVCQSSEPSAPDCNDLVEETATRRITLDNVMCSELTAFGTSQDYCTQQLENEPVVVAPTGREINTCSASTCGRP